MAGLVIYYSGGHKPILAARPAEVNAETEAQSAGTVHQNPGMPTHLEFPPVGPSPLTPEPAPGN